MRALCAVLVLVGLGCASVPVTGSSASRAQAELLDADRTFCRVAQEKGLAWAFADAMHPVDGRLFRPGRIVRGRSEIEAAPFPRDGQLLWEPSGAEAATSGDLGVTWGRWTLKTAERERESAGAYVTVWRKDAQGRWRGLLDIGNDDPPERPAPPPAAGP